MLGRLLGQGGARGHDAERCGNRRRKRRRVRGGDYRGMRRDRGGHEGRSAGQQRAEVRAAAAQWPEVDVERTGGRARGHHSARHQGPDDEPHDSSVLRRRALGLHLLFGERHRVWTARKSLVEVEARTLGVGVVTSPLHRASTSKRHWPAYAIQASRADWPAYAIQASRAVMLQAGQIIVHTGRPFEAVHKVLKKVARERHGEVLQVVQIIEMGLTSKCKCSTPRHCAAAGTTDHQHHREAPHTVVRVQ